VRSSKNPDRVRGQSRDANNKNPDIVEWEEVEIEDYSDYDYQPIPYEERQVQLSPEEERLAQEIGTALAAGTVWILGNVVAPWWKRTAWPWIKGKVRETVSLIKGEKKLIVKHRDLSHRIAELTEELEELRSEKKQLLAMLDYSEDTGLATVKKDVSAMEANLAKLEQQERKYAAELDAALAEYNELKAQAANFDPDELTMAQLEIRPQKEASAESKIQTAYGDKYDFWTMIGAKRDVAELLGEEEPRSLMERLRRKEREKERINRSLQPEIKKQRDRGLER